MTAELNFIVLKINGMNVNHLPHNETVQMFLTASSSDEPILIEVRRRKCDATYNSYSSNSSSNSNSNNEVNIVTDLNAELENLNIQNKSHDATTTATTDATNELLLTLLQPVVTNTPTETNQKTFKTCSTQTMDNNFFALYQQHDHVKNQENANKLIEQEHHLFEQCLAPEIDIEEITLRKSNSNERLGLTVCYSGGGSGSGGGVGIGGYSSNNNEIGSNNNGALSGSDDNDTSTEVYISDIHPESIAGRDGRLRQGDQILQINGKDIKNKAETETHIAENTNAVTLLVSRYLYADEDDFNDPSVEVDDVEDDDDEEEEFYDDNNLSYENCCCANDYINVVDELDKVLMVQVAAQQQQRHAVLNESQRNIIPATLATITKTTNNTSLVTAPAATPPAEVGFTATVPFSSTTKDHASKAKTSKYADASDWEPQQQQQQQQNVLRTRTKKDSNSMQQQQTFVCSNKTKAALVAGLAAATTTSHDIEYETEHIYETIPEDSESEPFYCSPYESSMYAAAVVTPSAAATISTMASNSIDITQLQQQKQRVAQWLGLKSTLGATTAPRQSMRSSSGCGRSLTHYDAANACYLPRNGTVNSALTIATNGSSSSGSGGGIIAGINSVCCLDGVHRRNALEELNDEHDNNSSSAYNTGGSNNSVSPLVLVLHKNNRNTSSNDEMFINSQRPDNSHAVIATAIGRASIKTQRYQIAKEKLVTSPKLIGDLPTNKDYSGGNTTVHMPTELQPPESQVRPYTPTTIPNDTLQQQQQFSPKTMYTNEANLQQTMLFQQQLFRQALMLKQQNQETQAQNNLHCPQFTAPNLSQYHFVSSQEVSAAHPSTTAATVSATNVVVTHKSATQNELSMVWKVKRRQDGSRYIVRRPARQRLITNTAHARNAAASTRNNSERLTKDLTTTEDDTISEVKIGRYWTREERKKHIERARARRQHQHMNIETMRLSDKMTVMQQRERASQQQHYQQQQTERLNRQNSTITKATTMTKQYFPLQFSSSTAQQQQPTTADIVAATTTLKTIFMPSKSVTCNLHICGLNDVVGTTTIATATTAATPATSTTTIATTTTAASIAEFATSIITSTVNATTTCDVVAVSNTQNSTNNTVDASKINNLLSVTTV